MIEPIPVGTRVLYHGSHTSLHSKTRTWIVRGHMTPETHPQFSRWKPDMAGEHYPDGVGYEIWPEDIPYKFGMRDHSLVWVRRASITPVEGSDVPATSPAG